MLQQCLTNYWKPLVSVPHNRRVTGLCIIHSGNNQTCSELLLVQFWKDILQDPGTRSCQCEFVADRPKTSYSMPLILPLSELSDLKQTEYLRALGGGVREEVLLPLSVLSSVYKYHTRNQVCGKLKLTGKPRVVSISVCFGDLNCSSLVLWVSSQIICLF